MPKLPFCYCRRVGGERWDLCHQLWRRLSEHPPTAHKVVDLREATFIDEAGEQLRLLANGGEGAARRRMEYPGASLVSPAATSSGQPLQYFIHYDSDALRMEISGRLVGRAAQEAYEAWRSVSLMASPRDLVVDISYVTEADEDGRAVLRRWREQEARIVASSIASRAIVESILSAPVLRPSPQRAFLDRLASLFSLPTTGRSAPQARALPRHV